MKNLKKISLLTYLAVLTVLPIYSQQFNNDSITDFKRKAEKELAIISLDQISQELTGVPISENLRKTSGDAAIKEFEQVKKALRLAYMKNSVEEAIQKKRQTSTEFENTKTLTDRLGTPYKERKKEFRIALNAAIDQNDPKSVLKQFQQIVSLEAVKISKQNLILSSQSEAEQINRAKWLKREYVDNNGLINPKNYPSIKEYEDVSFLLAAAANKIDFYFKRLPSRPSEDEKFELVMFLNTIENVLRKNPKLQNIQVLEKIDDHLNSMLLGKETSTESIQALKSATNSNKIIAMLSQNTNSEVSKTNPEIDKTLHNAVTKNNVNTY